jgi:hypothetical protein
MHNTLQKELHCDTQKRKSHFIYFVITLNSIEFAFIHFCFVFILLWKVDILTACFFFLFLNRNKNREKLGSLQQGLFINIFCLKMLWGFDFWQVLISDLKFIKKKPNQNQKSEDLGPRFYQIVKVYLKVLITSKVRA